MAGKQLRTTIVVRNPENLEAVALLEGSDLPDWAEGLVHDDELVSGGKSAPDAGGNAGDGPDFSKLKKDELVAEVSKRNADRAEADQIVVEEPGNKPELIAALEADDKQNPPS